LGVQSVTRGLPVKGGGGKRGDGRGGTAELEVLANAASEVLRS